MSLELCIRLYNGSLKTKLRIYVKYSLLFSVTGGIRTVKVKKKRSKVFLFVAIKAYRDPWPEGYRPQILVLSVLNWICWTAPALAEQNSWVRHWASEPVVRGKISLERNIHCCLRCCISFAPPASLYCDEYLCLYIYIYTFRYVCMYVSIYTHTYLSV